jgi:hypothetical protein
LYFVIVAESIRLSDTSNFGGFGVAIAIVPIVQSELNISQGPPSNLFVEVRAIPFIR